MKLLHIFISACIMLLLGAVYAEYKAHPTPVHGVALIQAQQGNGQHPSNTQKLFACLPFPARKRWYATLLSKRVWKNAKRVVKNIKTGKKTAFNHKQSVRLKKIAFNPA